MNVDATIDGRSWKVSVEPGEQPGTYTVTLKGRSRVIDAVWIDADTVSIVDGGDAREIRLHRRGGDASIALEVAGRLFEANVWVKKGRDGRTDPPPRGASAGPVSAVVKAPMPGRVVRVLVAPGDRVAARQPVVVVEAMKMENELRSPGDGTVTEVAVSAGAAVESGAVLVVIGD